MYYSALDTILRVEAKQNEIRALIMARNELAMYISKQRKVPKHLPEGNRPVEILRKSVVKKEMLKEEKREEKLETEVEEAFLPPTIDNMRDCKMCYAVESCMLYRKVSILLFSRVLVLHDYYRSSTRYLKTPKTLLLSFMRSIQVI